MVKQKIPQQGDIVHLNFSPQRGHEQANPRPALVISPQLYNQKTGLALLCPITPHIKGYPFEVLLPRSTKIQGAILADHLKNFDWKAQQCTFIEKAPPGILEETCEKLKTLITVV